jgi:hypothetical protein
VKKWIWDGKEKEREREREQKTKDSDGTEIERFRRWMLLQKKCLFFFRHSRLQMFQPTFLLVSVLTEKKSYFVLIHVLDLQTFTIFLGN